MLFSRSPYLAFVAVLLSSSTSMHSVIGFVTPAVFTSRHNNVMLSSDSSTLLRDSENNRAIPLPLTTSDLERLTALKARHKTIPLMIMDPLVPGQSISFQSADPRFHSLVHYVLSGEGEIGIVGFNPQTGKPLSVGVTLPVHPEDVVVDKSTKVVTLNVQAKDRFEVQGQPWMFDDDATITREGDEDNADAAFYLADVKTVDGRREAPLTDEAAVTTQNLADQIPNLIGTWVHHLVTKNKADALKMESRMMDLGPLPSSWTEQALWIAALLNPTSSDMAESEDRVCLEIRPAMLSCKNDHERMILATTALQSSIDHVSGKNKMF